MINMNGVEILATEEVAVAWANWNWKGFLSAIVFVFIITAIFSIVAGIADGTNTGIVIFLASFIIGSGLFGTLVGLNTVKPTEYETQYKVVIDDSVSMNEFAEKYELVDQDVKIYTIRERN